MIWDVSVTDILVELRNMHSVLVYLALSYRQNIHNRNHYPAVNFFCVSFFFFLSPAFVRHSGWERERREGGKESGFVRTRRAPLSSRRSGHGAGRGGAGRRARAQQASQTRLSHTLRRTRCSRTKVTDHEAFSPTLRYAAVKVECECVSE